MQFNAEYKKLNNATNRAIEKEIDKRYNNGEAEPEESFSDTLKRVKRYPAWKRAPDETISDFKKRISALDISVTIYPEWKRAPDETDEEFRHRYTNKKILKF